MNIVIQRVGHARVIVHEEKIASIQKGLLLLAGFGQDDSKSDVDEMVQKILKFRIFEDDGGKMNHSLLDVGGEVLLVPNFTLCADTGSGNRPSFGPAASPSEANQLFSYMEEQFNQTITVQTGEFGAHMEVSLLNDGPVTFVLDSDS